MLYRREIITHPPHQLWYILERDPLRIYSIMLIFTKNHKYLTWVNGCWWCVFFSMTYISAFIKKKKFTKIGLARHFIILINKVVYGGDYQLTFWLVFEGKSYILYITYTLVTLRLIFILKFNCKSEFNATYKSILLSNVKKS